MTMSMKCAIYARDILYGSPKDEAKKFFFSFYNVHCKYKIKNFEFSLSLSHFSDCLACLYVYIILYIYANCNLKILKIKLNFNWTIGLGRLQRPSVHRSYSCTIRC